MKITNAAVVLLAIGLPSPAAFAADVSEEVAELRQLIVEMRDSYEQRISSLEERLDKAERDASGARRDAGEAIEQSSGSSSPNTFNPAIGAILTGTFADVGPGWDEIPGFQPAGEIGTGDSGFAVGEAEVNLQASIDSRFYGNFTLALAEGEAEVEEASLQTTGLPAGLTLVGGRLFSSAGYLNGFHPHADDFVDRPLPYQAFFGGHYAIDGLQARWLAPTAFQDPHNLQARPSLIAATRGAELLICAGADLEIGWLPLLLRRSGNPGIQPGSPGHFLVADFVRRLEIPKSIDRSQGDVHPQGNPHMHLHPRNIERVANALADRLAELDPANAGQYHANLANFLARWDEATYVWEQQAEDLRGMRLVSHHKSFSYLADRLGLDIVANLEPKPGIPPSGAHLSKLLEQLTPNPPIGILRAPFENEKPSAWLSERLGVPEIGLPYTVGGAEDTSDLFALYEQTLKTLLEYRP